MKRQVKIFFSTQARDLIENMPNIKEEEIVEWFVNERKISIGGGDIIEYLKYLKEDKKNG
jgi:hypothetical protein